MLPIASGIAAMQQLVLDFRGEITEHAGMIEGVVRDIDLSALCRPLEGVS